MSKEIYGNDKTVRLQDMAKGNEKEYEVDLDSIIVVAENEQDARSQAIECIMQGDYEITNVEEL